MKRLLHWLACLCLLGASASGIAAGPTFSTERYIENRSIEALPGTDDMSGTIIVRRYDCPDCAPESYDFDSSLTVLFEGRQYPLATMFRWGTFPGDIVISKQTDRLVAVKRNTERGE